MTDFALQLAALEEDKVTPGLLGFTVVALLAMATWLLLRSMNKQIRRVNFEEPPPRRDVPTQRDDTPDDPSNPESAAAPGDETSDTRETQDNGAK
ncbi:hypothetical protein [Yinghuangia sp. YIM S09857]|uniref:hypothetical protein n=1 Tax=Yinghuangia sp. YIM S09857 TaxID=3436929 RepID=UPI003F533A5A